jgi:hypothetical protein
MTKLDKYHIFDRDCPFKNEWISKEVENAYEENYHKNINIWLDGSKKGVRILKEYEKKSKRSQSNI